MGPNGPIGTGRPPALPHFIMPATVGGADDMPPFPMPPPFFDQHFPPFPFPPDFHPNDFPAPGRNSNKNNNNNKSKIRNKNNKGNGVKTIDGRRVCFLQSALELQKCHYHNSTPLIQCPFLKYIK
eukprot:UN15188